MRNESPRSWKNDPPPGPKRTREEWATIGRNWMDAAPIVGLLALIYFVSTGMSLRDALVTILPLMVMIALVGWAVGFYGAQSRPAIGVALVATLLVTAVVGLWLG